MDISPGIPTRSRCVWGISRDRNPRSGRQKSFLPESDGLPDRLLHSQSGCWRRLVGLAMAGSTGGSFSRLLNSRVAPFAALVSIVFAMPPPTLSVATMPKKYAMEFVSTQLVTPAWPLCCLSHTWSAKQIASIESAPRSGRDVGQWPEKRIYASRDVIDNSSHKILERVGLFLASTILVLQTRRVDQIVRARNILKATRIPLPPPPADFANRVRSLLRRGYDHAACK
jgi:hypothetical protein